MKRAILCVSALANFFGYGIGRETVSLDHIPAMIDNPRRGNGKRASVQWAAGRTPPSYAYISRQVRRREQRKALKRMAGAVA